MTAPARNLVNLKDVAKGFAARTVLSGVTLGISAGDRVGIVGRNGDGKSTLLRLIGGVEEPDQGLVEALAFYQQAAADAAWSGDARDAVQALSSHPLVRSIDLAERLYAEMAEAHRAQLPERLAPA